MSGRAIRHTLLPVSVLAGTLLVGCNTIPSATPDQVASIQGTYAGEAVMNNPRTPGPVCAPRIPIVDFRVVGNQVHFGRFNGTIRVDGTVEMTLGATWITGQFQPPNGFVGQLLVPPVTVCRYTLRLQRGA